MNFPCVCYTAYPSCPAHHLPSTFPILFSTPLHCLSSLPPNTYPPPSASSPPSLCLVKAPRGLQQGHVHIYIKDTHRFTSRASWQAKCMCPMTYNIYAFSLSFVTRIKKEASRTEEFCFRSVTWGW